MDYNIQEIIEDFGVENTSFFRGIIKQNLELLQLKNQLYRLHITYPDLYYLDNSTKEPPKPLIVEPPPITLLELHRDIKHHRDSFLTKYHALLRSSGKIPDYATYYRTHDHMFTIVGGVFHDKLHDEFFIENDDLWVQLKEGLLSKFSFHVVWLNNIMPGTVMKILRSYPHIINFMEKLETHP